jgi:hypothetical protein
LRGVHAAQYLLHTLPEGIFGSVILLSREGMT